MSRVVKHQTAMSYVLRSFIPYTTENVILATNPHRYFNEIERLSGLSKKAIQNATWRAEKDGLLKREGNLLEITKRGLLYVQPLKPSKLMGDAQLMITFDIPEVEAASRRRLRRLLREWQFTQVQKSVWVTDLDYRKELIKAIREMRLEKYIQIFECARIYPKS